jgi:hypothetical protein
MFYFHSPVSNSSEDAVELSLPCMGGRRAGVDDI